LLSSLLLGTISMAHVAVAVPTTAATASVLVPQVTAGLSLLHLDGLAQDFKWPRKGILDSGFTVKSHETESTGTSGVLVDHKCCIDHTAELHEELLEVLLGCLLADTANEDFASLLLFITRNGTFGIDLSI
jgi:hypothetical protein